jgi:hypothetical protein
MPRTAAKPTIRDMTRSVFDVIDNESDRLRGRSPDVYNYVRTVLAQISFVGNTFAEDLANFVETNETRLNRLNADWDNGSLFDTICYDIKKDDFTFSDKHVPVQDLLVICGTFRGGTLSLMDTADVRRLTGHTLRRVRALSTIVSE